MRHKIKTLVGNQDNLSGSILGQKLFASLVSNTPVPLNPEPIFLDFEGIHLATSSYLRESVIAFRNYTRISLSNAYPIVANASDSVLEELEFFLRHQRDAFWICRVSEDGRVSDVKILGELDKIQEETFDYITKHGSATASELAEKESKKQKKGEKIGATAWNNRLSTLAGKRLVIERRVGKTKEYSLVLGGNDGT